MSLWQSGLRWIESSALGHAIRDAGVWTYATINLLHIIGVATLFGSMLILDARLLGWRRSASLADVALLTVPAAIAGFLLAALSGLCMLATNGSEYIGNPFLPIKFIAIAAALCNALVLSRTVAWQTKSASASGHLLLQIAGGISLLCWLTALAAGRMVGYW
jgi:formate-dependent nitrite reductase membrane component NrfD